jgi:hypothetical protein
MSDKQKANPKVEWGYFAVTPRILRTQYKQLSHTEKWLYTCLKDLCGDKGMCFRTLRVLSQETDLSIGNLSIGIRHLHEAGLIHAEKKRRSNNPTAKEVWHISIVDIWKSNVEYCSNYEHSAENVQEMNDNVQIMNNPPLERSFPEQKRSNFDDRRNNIEEQHSEERTSEEHIGVSADASTPPAFYASQEIPVTYNEALAYLKPHGPHEGLDAVAVVKLAQKLWTEAHETDNLSEKDGSEETTQASRVIAPALTLPSKQTSSQARAGEHEHTDGAATDGIGGEPRASGKQEKPKRSRKPATEEPEPVLPEAIRILDDWDALQRKPVPRTERLIASAKALVPRNPTREELKGCRDWLPTTDRPGKPWYRLHGVGLWDIAEKIGQWDSLEGMAIEPVPLADIAPKKPMDIYTAASLDPERSQRNYERLRAKRLAREAEAQQGGTQQ